MIESLFGAGIHPAAYFLVILGYLALTMLVLIAAPTVPLFFRRTFWTLYAGWAPGTLIGNYLLYKLGVMSFLPWLNNLLHTMVWIGLSLGLLYSAVHHRSGPFKFAVFALASFVVKVLENALLGTWELDHFFGLHGRWAYILGWSLLDGFYPLLSETGLRLLSGVVPGLIAPSAFARSSDAITRQGEGGGPAGMVGDLAASVHPGNWVTWLLAVLTVWDLALGLFVIAAPTTWTTMIHGEPLPEPLGLLARTGASWLAFALVQGLATVRWRREAFWLAIVAGLRAGELIADGVYLVAASSIAPMGAAGLLVSAVGNVVLTGVFFVLGRRGAAR